MKRLSLFISLMLVGLVVAAPSVQAASKTLFTGAWTSTDVDGSTQYLAVSGGTDVHVTYIDLGGSICANNGSPTAVFQGSMTGSVTGGSLDATFTSARCGPVFFDFLVGSSTTWTYDSGTGQIFDGVLYWSRP